jgi:hypothetical protein
MDLASDTTNSIADMATGTTLKVYCVNYNTVSDQPLLVDVSSTDTVTSLKQKIASADGAVEFTEDDDCCCVADNDRVTLRNMQGCSTFCLDSSVAALASLPEDERENVRRGL